jgi:predicted signal transduction protein with EAL and GGDEF domain
VARRIGERLGRAAAGSPLVARVGDDSFAVLVEDIDDPDTVRHLALDIVRVVGDPVSAFGSLVTLGAYVGVAFSWRGEGTADELLAGADLALARSQQKAPGSVEIYDEGLQEQLQHQASVEEALRRGIAGDELFLQYQPIIDLGTGRLSSVEALVRWNRGGQGIQPPDSFIPIAERTPLIVDLDRWVMGRAGRQLADWRDHVHLRDVDVTVNVSGRHVTGGRLHAHVVDLLDATGIDPRHLVVEITETVLVDDLLLAAADLEAVRALGVRIALDDFGTGYTSIAHLQRLPVDIIKIDRSFVSRIDRPQDRALLAMITELGHQLGMTIVAEGVETEDQYRQLRELGCDRAQGYLMSRPLAPELLEAWAEASARGPAWVADPS